LVVVVDADPASWAAIHGMCLLRLVFLFVFLAPVLCMGRSPIHPSIHIIRRPNDTEIGERARGGDAALPEAASALTTFPRLIDALLVGEHAGVPMHCSLRSIDQPFSNTATTPTNIHPHSSSSTPTS
jgi:hypothetical protein